MAESLSPEQIEERRENLAFIRENVMDMKENVFGDHLFTTTLLMQEEWLATVDALAAEVKGLKELAFNYHDFTPNCDEDGKCFACGEQWYPNECEDTCPATLLFEATKDARDTSSVWLDLTDELETARKERDEAQRDANILNGLRLRKCLRGTGGLALECQDCYDDITEFCAPCYLRAIHLTPEQLEGIREGVQDVKEGRTTPWSEVEASMPPPLPPLPIVDDLPECEGLAQAHVWACVGTAKDGTMEWGQAKCMRCNTPFEGTIQVNDLDLGRDCCFEHDCPHHDGMVLNAAGGWEMPSAPEEHEHVHVHDGAGRLEHSHSHHTDHHNIPHE